MSKQQFPNVITVAQGGTAPTSAFLKEWERLKGTDIKPINGGNNTRIIGHGKHVHITSTQTNVSGQNDGLSRLAQATLDHNFSN